jgi:polyisoprenoid-binding protein YceI
MPMHRLPATLLLAAAAAAAQSHHIAPLPESRMELRVAKTGFLRGKQHLFVFERYSGVLRYDPQQPESSEVNVIIEAASAVCKDTWLSPKDLRKVQDFALKDMLDAAHHREITFASSAIRRAAAGGFEVHGMLTIRGISKSAAVTIAVADRKEGKLSFQGSATVRLTDYGLKPPSAALGTIGTKDEMAFSFTLTANPDPE